MYFTVFRENGECGCHLFCQGCYFLLNFSRNFYSEDLAAVSMSLTVCPLINWDIFE
jgi:hypothetical protein